MNKLLSIVMIVMCLSPVIRGRTRQNSGESGGKQGIAHRAGLELFITVFLF